MQNNKKKKEQNKKVKKMKTNYTNLEKIKALLGNEEIKNATKWMYVYKSESSQRCFTKIAETLFGNEKLSDLVGDIPSYDYELIHFYNAIQLFERMDSEDFVNTIKDLVKTVKVKNEFALKKRARKIQKILTNHVQSEKVQLYRYLYSSDFENYSFEDFRRLFQSESDKEKQKIRFIKYIQNTDFLKKKQSKRYSVSRDMDKDTYYITNEGRLAKIKTWQYLKRVKRGDIYNYVAQKTIDEGVIVKPMKLINKIMPKAHENMKLFLASLFEGIKPCTMKIDRDFKTAYDPYYNNHQDTDGDKASNYSCMSGEGDRAQEFYGKINGCNVVRWELEDGTQVGRCIMYEYNGVRHFIRIYGLYPYHRTMINMLEAQMGENDLFGRNATIKNIKLPTTIDEDTHLMYLDGNNYGLREEKGQWYMVADNYDTDCKTTSGDTIEEMMEDTSICEHCGRRYSNDDGIWVNDYFYCCSECAENDGWRCCERCGEWEHEDDCIWIEGVGYYCCETCAKNAGYDYDDYNEEWTDQNELGETNDGRYCTTKSGAADYYNVDEDQVDWDTENHCWKNLEAQNNEEQEGENND